MAVRRAEGLRGKFGKHVRHVWPAHCFHCLEVIYLLLTVRSTLKQHIAMYHCVRFSVHCTFCSAHC